MKNKIITSEGNIQFIDSEGKVINISPSQVYSMINEDTVSFLLVHLPKSSGLSLFTTKVEDLELNGATYSQSTIADALAEAFSEAGAVGRIEVVDELPSEGKTNTIYLLPKDEGEGYDEYIYIKDESKWELIGDTSIEIKNFLKKSDFNEYSAATKTAIENEIDARESSDSVISGAVDSLSTDLLNESQRAQNAESAIDAKVSALSANTYTKAEVDAAVSGKVDASTFETYSGSVETALSAKVDTSAITTSITSASTDSQVPSAKAVYDALQEGGGSDINVVQTTGTSTTDVMSQSAVTTAINNKANKTAAVGGYQFGETNNVKNINFIAVGGGFIDSAIYYPKINGKGILTNSLTFAKNNYNFQLVDSSAITTSITSGSTDAQVPSAKAVYDALQEGGGSSYTAGDGIDITNDVISVTGKVDTSTYSTYTAATDTALASKQDTLVSGTNIKTINNESILGSGNITIEGGGGKAVSAGTNISITTGETADTINCTLPIFVHSNSGRGDIMFGTDINANSDFYRLGIGRRIDMSSSLGGGSIAIGVATSSSSDINKCYGGSNVAIGRYFQVGESNTYSGARTFCVVIGNEAKSLINKGVAIGYKTVASGTTQTNINNQLTIDTSNQVYISNSANTSTYCLQEKIENTEAALGGLNLVKLSQSEYDALSTKDSNTLYVIVN